MNFLWRMIWDVLNIHKSHPPKKLWTFICFTVLIFLNTSLAFQYFFAEFLKIIALGVGFSTLGVLASHFLCARKLGNLPFQKIGGLPGGGGDGQAWIYNDRNEPADYKSSATRTVNHESNLLSCEISLHVYAQIWQMIYCFDLQASKMFTRFFLYGSIECIPEGPPPGDLGRGWFFCAKSPTLGDKLLSNFPKGRGGAMGRGSFHAKVLVLFIKNGGFPLQLIKKYTKKNSRYL